MNHLRSRFGPATVRPHSVRPGNSIPPLFVRLNSATSEAPALAPLARDAKLARLEAALLIADEPLPARRVADIVGLADAGEAKKQIERLRELYDLDGTAFQIEEIAGGYQLLTRTRY